MNLDPEIIDILKNQKAAALGTIMDGNPYISAIGYIYEPPVSPSFPGHIYFLLSDIAQHTRNLKQHPNVSLLITALVSGDTPIHETHRMTLQGRVDIVASYEEFLSLKAQYLAIYPRTEVLFELPDFRFYQLTIHELYWIGGFGKAKIYK